MSDNPFVGSWTYRSFLNDAGCQQGVQRPQIRRGTIVIEEAPMQSLKGTIGGPGWSLALKGARSYGNPMHARFQGVGIVERREVGLRLRGLPGAGLAERRRPDPGHRRLGGTHHSAFGRPARLTISPPTIA